MAVRQAAFAALLAILGLAGASCDDFRTPAHAGSHASAAIAPAAGTRAAPASATVPEPAPAAANDSAPAAMATASLALIPAPDPVPVPTDPRAQPIEAAAAGDLKGRPSKALLIKLEVLLDRANFSPGVIDGQTGSNLAHAINAYETAHGLPDAAGKVDDALIQALAKADTGPVTQDYVITADDAKGPYLGAVPQGFEAMAALPRLDYSTPLQALAERFHMSQALLTELNPGADLTKAGTSILVVRPGAGRLTQPAARIEVDKNAGQVRVLGTGGDLLAAYPATVGSTERPAPSGEWAVTAVAANPNYTYDPSRLTFGPKSKGKLTIAPGPNNPVGSTWIALTAPTYGIHGAPDPTKVGKTASHGCVRLTNWDAAALGRAVKKGTPVIFVGVETKKA
jgi:lipoprotein-anchoring transpeptidase ErfK/SrfK